MGDAGAELSKLLEKALAASSKIDDGSGDAADEERTLDALRLMGTFEISTQILMDTKAGVKLRKLTKTSHQQIQEAASGLLDSWKQAVTAESKSAESAKPKPSVKALGPKVNSQLEKSLSISTGLSSPRPARGGETTSSSQERKAAARAPGEAAGSQRGGAAGNEEPKEAGNGAAGAPGGRTGGAGVGFASKPAGAAAGGAPPKLQNNQKTGDTMRDKLREMMMQSLAMVAGEAAAGGDAAEAVGACNPARVAVLVESEMWATFAKKSDLKEYKAKYRSISFNLKDPNNPDLRRRVLVGEVAPARLMTMTAEEMASDARQAENREIKTKLTEEAVRGQHAQAASTDQFRCAKCKHRKTTYYQLQTRSADEPMTTYVTCMNCNNRWKFC